MFSRHCNRFVPARGLRESSVQAPQQDSLVISPRHHQVPVMTELQSVDTAVVSQQVLREQSYIEQQSVRVRVTNLPVQFPSSAPPVSQEPVLQPLARASLPQREKI